MRGVAKGWRVALHNDLSTKTMKNLNLVRFYGGWVVREAVYAKPCLQMAPCWLYVFITHDNHIVSIFISKPMEKNSTS